MIRSQVSNMSTDEVSFPQNNNYEVNTRHLFSKLEHKMTNETRFQSKHKINLFFTAIVTIKWLICQTSSRKLAELANTVSCLFINLPTLVSLTT